ncbi:EamA-like transporter family protein [Thalassovita gelatinovora]|uniref:EamA-like transporter family protein n=1 Tax=Thalassovita gelatinovora TaxID=53501 RepID=A0A0P1FBT9_THAGE|nr:DMT family transporter [Thalassovita gelatinovora]QIZ80012.1 DMT family transporter [Thalassovita gelatinovora]CUH65696.1 EamA-like transporter family protein [Thalassovita gelatinovora]SER04832.1 EamA-like transporter family protein [Thalassovita gelatinovora]
MIWVLVSIAAAAFQTLRFMLQKFLSMGAVSSGGATLSRFLFSAPFVLVLALGYVGWGGAGLPDLGSMFLPYALSGAVAQILATWCVVALFAKRNFAVGITFKKTEVVQTALVGFVVLGDRVSLEGSVAILLGLIGVLVLSQAPEGQGGWARRFFNKGAGLGLLSGAFFAVSAVGYRGATLQVGSDDPLMRALVSLAFVTVTQAVGLSLWLVWREPGQLRKVIGSWRTSVWIGLTGLGGSLGWFTAFTLQNAAYVFAVGQIEVIFSIVASVLFFRESLSRREIAGIALISGSVLSLVLFL